MIRCKDCIHHIDTYVKDRVQCKRIEGCFPVDWFCADGERNGYGNTDTCTGHNGNARLDAIHRLCRVRRRRKEQTKKRVMRSAMKRLTEEDRFARRFCCWANNHKGWSKTRKRNRRQARRRLKRGEWERSDQ